MFESYPGVVLKSRVMELLDVFQNSCELTDDQAALSILLIATSRLRLWPRSPLASHIKLRVFFLRRGT
jgi:hypothetical protein